MYSPMIPMKKSWTDEKKNRLIRIGATPTVNSFQNTSLATR